ncbi:unnamed protein product [Orchesella dallaii]|uniref:Uncharacterized protein n=1 Tax=Orchesella dallaii TaxID=48710 RepID=A0ABP1RQY8_9HEXA
MEAQERARMRGLSSFGSLNDFPVEVIIRFCYLVARFAYLALTDRSLEKFCLSYWTNWDPRPVGTLPDTPFPKMSPIIPFSSKSLCIDQKGWQAYKKTNKATKIEMFPLLKLYGSHLTSLWIDGLQLDIPKVNLLFKELVNLKALNISNVPKVKNREPQQALTVPPPPNLQYLRLVGIANSDWDMLQCLVNVCLTTRKLTSLEMDGCRAQYDIPWQTSKNLILPPSSSVAYQSLTKLKICGPNKSFLRQKMQLKQLRHLAVNGVDSCPDDVVTLNDIIIFLDNFSSSLTRLYLNYHLINQEDRASVNLVEHPNVRELYIFLPWALDRQDRVRQAHIHQVFLKKFPNLESLHLLSAEVYSDECYRENRLTRKELESLFNLQNCFELCPKLKTLTLNQRADNQSNLPVYKVTVTREGTWMWKLLEGFRLVEMKFWGYDSSAR